LVVITFLNAEQPGKLNLRKNDMLRQSLDKSEIEDLLRLGQGFFGIKRPRLITHTTTLSLGFQDSKNDYRGDDNNQQQKNRTHLSFLQNYFQNEVNDI